jgi:hypothetical protein
MALNISRFFKRTPEVAAGDVNGDGAVNGQDAAAGRGAQPSGVMQDYYAHSNVMADGHEGDMATHEAARAAAGQTHNALDAGFSISDDALDAARTAQGGLGARGGGLGVKWEGPDFDASKGSLITEVGFPKVEGPETSFTAAEGRSMSFELLKGDGPGPGATERTMGPGGPGQGAGLRDMEIDLGHGGTLNHAGGPSTDASGNSLLTELKFPAADGYTATDDLWKFRGEAQDGSGTDNANRTMGPGHQGSGFMMQDGELYPRARGFDSDDPQATSGSGNTPGHGDGPDTGAIRDIILKRGEGYTATDDLWKFRGEAQEGSGTDNASRTMGPGHQGSGFMMQDGELYPRGIEGAAGPLKWGAPGREASDYASIEFASLRPEHGSNDIELRAALSEAQDGSGTDNANRTVGPGHQGSGFMMQDGELYPRARGFDSDDPQATSGPGPDDGPDTGAIRDIILKRGESYTATDDLWKFRSENPDANAREAGSGMATGRRQFEPLHAEGISSQHGGMDTTGESPEFDEADALFGRVRHDAPGGLPARDLEGQMAGFHTEIDGQPAGVLPEVNDEVLVSFSALEADADAPTTLVDLHSHAANAEGLIGHVEIPHLDPGHHDLGGGHHGHGFIDYTDDAAIDN